MMPCHRMRIHAPPSPRSTPIASRSNTLVPQPSANGAIHTSLGHRPGPRPQMITGLKARPTATASVPQIAFIKSNPVFGGECPEFLLETPRPMMVLLLVDVMNQRVQVRRPD